WRCGLGGWGWSRIRDLRHVSLPPLRGCRGFHRGHEPVPQPGQSFYVTRRGGGVTQNLPELLDRSIESVFKIHERVRRPDLLPDFFAADNFSGMLQQNFQNEIRLAAQIDLRPVLVELAGGGL